MNEILRPAFAGIQVERLGPDANNLSILSTLDIGRRFANILVSIFQDALISHPLALVHSRDRLGTSWRW